MWTCDRMVQESHASWQEFYDRSVNTNISRRGEISFKLEIDRSSYHTRALPLLTLRFVIVREWVGRPDGFNDRAIVDGAHTAAR